MKVSQRYVLRLLQTVFFLLALLFLWHQLAEVSTSEWHKLNLAFLKSPLLLSAVLLFVPLNWWVESKKWQLLNRDFNSITTATAARGVLGGTYLSLFTPNRIGDLAGKIYLTSPGKRSKAASASAFGSLSQLTVTSIAGLFGLAFLLDNRGGFDPLWAILLTGLAIGVLVAFFKMDVVWRRVLVKFNNRWKRAKNFHYNFSYVTASRTLLLSFLRYAIFSSQFILLLSVFGVELPIGQSYAAVAVVYLISSVIPASLLGELGIRESVAIFIFSLLGQEAFPVFAATFTLWVFNLILPAVFGSFFIGSASARFIRLRS